ncbi:MAG: hypothetical protein ACTSYA_09400 [Candidatus Kariarchaeaceae archaeon]
MDKVELLERLWFLPITIFLLLFFIEITLNFKKKAKKYSFDKDWLVIKTAQYSTFRSEYFNFLSNNLIESSSVEVKARRIRQKIIHIFTNSSDLEPWQLTKALKSNSSIGNLDPDTRLYQFLKNPEIWVKKFLSEQPFLTRKNPIRRKNLVSEQFIEIIQEFRVSWDRKSFFIVSNSNNPNLTKKSNN